MKREKVYIAIDLKSFYASVECITRGLDPMNTNLVVADKTRTEKTICLAVTPTLKKYGISGRARLFEVIERVSAVNKQRAALCGGRLEGSSCYESELMSDTKLAVDYIIASPQMAYYMEYSANIYNIYLKYISVEDIHVYSIDEVFIDVTNYLKASKLSPSEFAMKIILDVLRSTGITATAGIGTNLYLCKIAMDVLAKRIEPDENGVRIAELNEKTYRELLWSHTPITDFWRVGRGTAERLEEQGIYTMGDVARCSLTHEDMLYRLFGVNAELLVDHAWGFEPCTIADIKAYRPENESICSGQILKNPYTYDKARLVVREMADLISLELVDKGLVTDQLVLTVGYDIDNIDNDDIEYVGDVTVDRYGRGVPKHAHGTVTLDEYTSSTKKITDEISRLYDRIINKELLVRRININVNRLINENNISYVMSNEQISFFPKNSIVLKQAVDIAYAKERKKQETLLKIKKKYGKNAIIRGMNLEEGATAVDRNQQIGGHKA